jgi:hypothetical protein
MLVGFEEVGVGHSESLCGRARFAFMNPRDYKTWTTFADHPIFSDRKHIVAEWSSDPSVYGDLKDYSTFKVDWYVHQDGLPTEVHASFAARDIRILVESCAAIEREFGDIQHEVFILDDFTVYVRIVSSQFDIELYPDNLSDEGHVLGLFIDSPETDESELHLSDIAQLVPTLLQLLVQTRRRTT